MKVSQYPTGGIQTLGRRIPVAPTRRRPPAILALSIGLFVLAIPFKAMSVFDLEALSFGVAPVYIAFFILSIAYSLTYLGRRLRLAMPRPLVYLIAFGLFSVASIVQSARVPPDYLHLSIKVPFVFGATQAMYILASVLAVFILFEVFVSFPNLVRTALRAHFMSALFVSLWGLYQFAAYYGNWPYPLIFNNNEYYSQLYMQMMGPLKRVNSTALEPSMLAIYLCSVLPISLYSVVFRLKVLSRLLDFIVLSVVSLVLLLTTALTAFLGLAVFVAIVGIKGRLARLPTILVLGVISGTFILILNTWSREIERFSALEPIVERFSSVQMHEDFSTTDRWNSIVVASAMFVDHPIVGVGVGNSAFYYYFYAERKTYGFYPRIHAYGARIASELGLVGMVLVGVFIYLVIGSRPSKELDKSEHILWESLLVAFLTCFILLMTTQGDINHYEVWYLCSSVLALSQWRDRPVARLPNQPKRSATLTQSR